MSDQETRNLVTKLFNMQALSEQYVDVVVSYFKYARHGNEVHIKEVEKAFKNIEQSRLLDNSYSLDEVRDILKSLLSVVQGVVRTEFQNSVYSSVELLRQVLSEADNCGLKMKIDVSNLETEDASSKIQQLEQKLSKAAKLPSLGSHSLLSSEEIHDIKEENQKLKEKLSKIQQNYTQMMKDKTSVTEQLAQARDEIERIRLEKGDAEWQASSSSQDAAKKKQEAASLEKQKASLQEQNQQSEADRQTLISEKQKLEQQLADAKNEIKSAQKELAAKINDTTQFKNMRKMVQTKNNQIKELRDRLSKYEAVGDSNEDANEF